MIYLTFCDRYEMIRCLPSGGAICELGVFKGATARIIQESLTPERLVLIDRWHFDFKEDWPVLLPFPDEPPHFKKLREVAEHFFGADGEHLHEAQRLVLEHFGPIDNVYIIKGFTHEVVKQFDDETFDMIYIDATHQYEYVLRDLMEWAEL